MAIKKFENINIKKDIKKEKVKLTKEEKKLLKEKKKLKKKELKEIRKEDKKVLLTTKELLPFKDADDDDSIITKMGHIDIFSTIMQKTGSHGFLDIRSMAHSHGSSGVHDAESVDITFFFQLLFKLFADGS